MHMTLLEKRHLTSEISHQWTNYLMAKATWWHFCN